MKHKSLFSFFRDDYRIAYSHNTIVNKLFRKFTDDISFLRAQRDLFLRNPLAFDRAFAADEDIAEVAYERAVKKTEDGYSYSLFFSSLYDRIERERAQALSADYPRGVPRTGQDNYFLLEQGVDWGHWGASQDPQTLPRLFSLLAASPAVLPAQGVCRGLLRRYARAVPEQAQEHLQPQ